MRQGLETLRALEVERVVDGRLRPQRALLLEVLLDVRVLELDVQARCYPAGDHARLVAETWWRRIALESSRKQEADAIWSAEVKVVANHRLEKLATVDRCGEDLGQTHFELPDAQAMAITSGTIGWRKRPWQALKPAIEE